tara:strand:- start:3055 stop:3807 length:753 start_codon:yes stop_codon:yes gene_type:complete
MRRRILLLSILIISSCSTKKDILYLQDHRIFDSNELKLEDQKIQVGHILSINVATPFQEASIEFNRARNYAANSVEMLRIEGYNVDNDGTIIFPVIGKIYLNGLTINEAQNSIHEILLNKGLLKNHSVEIKILNSSFTILGEVNNPGTYFYYENGINILKAIGLAGDLTINGKRNDIKIIRDKNGIKSISQIDLTSSNFLNSPFYYIRNGDVIIINPNTNRIKNAGIIGNSGTLISLFSFILTSIILITN